MGDGGQSYACAMGGREMGKAGEEGTSCKQANNHVLSLTTIASARLLARYYQVESAAAYV